MTSALRYFVMQIFDQTSVIAKKTSLITIPIALQKLSQLAIVLGIRALHIAFNQDRVIVMDFPG